MSQVLGMAVFDTALGAAGLVWRGEAVVGACLPEPSGAAATARLRRRFPDAQLAEPPPVIAGMIADIVAMLAGEPRAVEWAALDLGDAPELHRRVYAAAARTPYGCTTTYGDIARELGDLALSQAVGQALGANPIPILVPCHRVLGADGKAGGFSGGEGVATKLKLLNIERARPPGPPMLFDELPLAARNR